MLNFQDFLVAIGLSKYVLAFHQQELDDLEQLVACTDEYLKTVIRMKPDDVTIFREALVRDGLVERPSYKDATVRGRAARKPLEKKVSKA